MRYYLAIDIGASSGRHIVGWQDEQGRVFIHYTIHSLAATIQRSEMTVKNALKALEQRGFIYRHRQGVGMPNRIYVKVQTENCLTGGTTFG